MRIEELKLISLLFNILNFTLNRSTWILICKQNALCSMSEIREIKIFKGIVANVTGTMMRIFLRNFIFKGWWRVLKIQNAHPLQTFPLLNMSKRIIMKCFNRWCRYKSVGTSLETMMINVEGPRGNHGYISNILYYVWSFYCYYCI